MDPAQQPTPAKPAKKKLLPLLLILLLFGAIVLWFFVFPKSSEAPTINTQKTASSSAEKATSSAPPVVDNLALIKAALVKKTGLSKATIAVTISSQSGELVKGYVGTKGEQTGGGYFLAVKVSGTWIIVYNGQATPDCTAVNPYNFPISMVPECLDASGNLVKR